FHRRRRIGIERLVLLPVVEPGTVDVIDGCLGRGVLGENQRMIVEFHMVVDEGLRDIALIYDRGAVHERAGLDKDSIDEDGVVGRHEKVPTGYSLVKSASPNANRE